MYFIIMYFVVSFVAYSVYLPPMFTLKRRQKILRDVTWCPQATIMDYAPTWVITAGYKS